MIVFILACLGAMTWAVFWDGGPPGSDLVSA